MLEMANAEKGTVINMNCDIVKDLIPLYIDGCCSEESRKIIEEHIENCVSCKKLLDDMTSQPDIVTVSNAPAVFSKLNDWKASVMQSVLLFFSFALITIGVALESQTPSGSTNGFWAVNLVVPATGFMLSLANWYFVRLYKSRRSFSKCSLAATLGITTCAYVWAVFHYGSDFFAASAGRDSGALQWIASRTWIGILLTLLFCTLSPVLSNLYAKMLGKE